MRTRAKWPVATWSRTRVAGAALLLLPVVAPPALAQPAPAAQRTEVPVRTGQHPDFGRVVFDLPPGVTWRTGRNGDALTVRFTGADGIAATDSTTRNVRAIAPLPNGALITMAPGAHARAWRLGTRLVVDVFDPAPKAAQSTAAPIVAAPAPVPAAIAPTRLHAAAPAPSPQASQSGPARQPLAATPQQSPAAPTPAPGAVASPAPPAAPPSPEPSAQRKPAQNAPAQSAPAQSAPAPAAPAQAAATQAASAPATAALTPVNALAALSADHAKAAPAPGPRPAPLIPVSQAAAAPTNLALAAVPAVAPGGQHAITLPFAAGTGAAAFRRGGTAIVVFDEKRPVDLAALRDDPAFGAAAITLLPAATVLRLPLPATQDLSLTRTRAGWTVAIAPAGTPQPAHTPIRPEFDAGRLRLPAAAPGLVISVPDPLTGGALLVGTLTAAGQGVPIDRRAPEFVLLPTWQGVAVAPSSDGLTLRPSTHGFVLAADGQRTLALSVPNAAALAAAAAHALSRRWDFPDLPTDGLMRRAQAAIAAAATTPPQARGPKRLAVAQAFIALGLGAEAQAILRIAATDDGRLADDPGRIGLSAIAALLADRIPDSAGIADPRLDGTDEVALWRALRTARLTEGSPAAAPVLAATLPLLLSYPKPLRDRLLPLAAETMALGGEHAAAARLLAGHKQDPALQLAAGLLAESEGKTKDALAIYDKQAQSEDRLVRARAAFHAVQLRVADGSLPPAAAADALDRQIFAWRGDGRELKVRLRTAELRAEAGDPRRALALLRETADLFPNDAADIHRRLEQTFAAALAAESSHPLPPLDLVALAEENADLIPAGDAGHALASHLANRLVALDLPGRALPVLQKLADAAPPGDARSELGGRLAALRLEQGDAKGALATLAATLGVGRMPPALLESRTLTFARAAAATGHLDQATRALVALDTAAGDELRATLLEKAKDWPGARTALLAWTARIVPPEGTLTPPQATALLRLASAAAQAGDEALLARLHEHDLPRMPAGNLSDMFRLLTAGPVQAVSDLGRAAQETQLAGRFPQALKSLTSDANPAGPPTPFK